MAPASPGRIESGVQIAEAYEDAAGEEEPSPACSPHAPRRRSLWAEMDMLGVGNPRG